MITLIWLFLALIHLKDKKILITLSRGKDTWYIPGGKRAQGETDIQALTREIKEELNVDLIEESIKLYGIFEAPAHGKENMIVRMTCYFGNFSGTPIPSSEIEKLDYFLYDQKGKTSAVDHLIFDSLKKKGLII